MVFSARIQFTASLYFKDLFLCFSYDAINLKNFKFFRLVLYSSCGLINEYRFCQSYLYLFCRSEYD